MPRLCSKCGAAGPFYERSHYCKPCHNADTVARGKAQRDAETPEQREERLALRRLKDRGRAERTRHPVDDPVEYKRRKAREYYARNRQARIAYQRARRNADPEASRAYEREVYKRRREKHQATNRARERAMERPDADTVAYDAILRRDPCAYCGGSATQVDHVVPVASGGRNHWTNLAAACQPCNREKSHKPLLAFLAGRTV